MRNGSFEKSINQYDSRSETVETGRKLHTAAIELIEIILFIFDKHGGTSVLVNCGLRTEKQNQVSAAD